MKANTERKLNIYKVRRCIALLIILIVLIIILVVNLNKKNNHDELYFLLNNKETEYEHIFVQDENKIYFSFNDVKNLFDNNIYYNDAEKELITTYNKHVALLKVDETFMVLNDSNVDLVGGLREIDKSIFLPIKDLSIVYDIDISYSEKNNTLMIDSINKEKKEVKSLKRLKVKEKKGWFKRVVDIVEPDSDLVVIGEEDNYYNVRTQDGAIGYVKKNKVSDIIVVRENYEENKLDLNILSTNGEYQISDDMNVEDGKLNVICPSVASLDKDSKIATNASVNTSSFKAFMEEAGNKNIYVCPSIKNNVLISENLLTYSQRNKFINELYNYVFMNGFKGVYINFENIDDVNSFYRFLIELTPKFKESGLYVIVENKSVLNKEKLEKIVDYVVEVK